MLNFYRNTFEKKQCFKVSSQLEIGSIYYNQTSYYNTCSYLIDKLERLNKNCHLSFGTLKAYYDLKMFNPILCGNI